MAIWFDEEWPPPEPFSGYWSPRARLKDRILQKQIAFYERCRKNGHSRSVQSLLSLKALQGRPPEENRKTWVKSLSGLTAIFAVLLCNGCLQVKTWDGQVYECPKELLTNVQAKLEELCPAAPAPQSTPKP